MASRAGEDVGRRDPASRPQDAVGLAEEVLARAEVEGALEGHDAVDARVGHVHGRGRAQPEVQPGVGEPLPRRLDVQRGDVQPDDAGRPEAPQPVGVLVPEAEAHVEDRVALGHPRGEAQLLGQRVPGVVEARGPVPPAEVEVACALPEEDAAAEQRVQPGRLAAVARQQQPEASAGPVARGTVPPAASLLVSLQQTRSPTRAEPRSPSSSTLAPSTIPSPGAPAGPGVDCPHRRGRRPRMSMHRPGTRRFLVLAVLALAWAAVSVAAAAPPAAEPTVARRLAGFDAYMEKLLKDWNVPGIGVGDRGRRPGRVRQGLRLPRLREEAAVHAEDPRPDRLQHASSSPRWRPGMLVEEGKLDWDGPVPQSVPSIRFYNDELDATVTLRDMLAPPHRHHPPRHHLVQVRLHAEGAVRPAALPRAEGADAPALPLQQHDVRGRPATSIELAVGQDLGGLRPRAHLRAAGDDEHASSRSTRWRRRPDHGVPFTERRDSIELYEIPYYEAAGVGPAGSIISNLEDMSKLADRAHERREARRAAGPAGRGAEGDARARHRPAQHGARDPRLGRAAQPGLRHGALDRVLPRPPDRLPRRRHQRLPLAGLRACPRRASAWSCS